MNRKWILAKQYEVSSILRYLADLDISTINIYLDIVKDMKKDNSLMECTDSTLYSYYLAKLETLNENNKEEVA